MAKAILSGVRVLDCGRYIAGPCCAAMLGDLGAEVIRVERREGGDDRWLGPATANGEGGMFLQNNRNKLSITLNFMLPEGRAVLERLVRSCDIVVSNLTQQQMRDAGLDFASIEKVRADIILTWVSAYGSGGPYSDRLGFDAVGQVMCGAVRRSGWPDQPVRTAVPYVDYSTALAATVGTLAAILHRNKTGEGQQVEASLISTALTISSGMLIEQALTHVNREATLNRGQQSAPNNIYALKDGFVLIQVVGQPIFKRWATLMGEDHWLSDPRFGDDAARGDNWEVLDARTAQWCSGRTVKEALTELEKARIPAYPVNSVQEALDDQHIQMMGYFHPTPYPEAPGPVPMVEPPFRLSRFPIEVKRAPVLGEHSEQILAGLGYSSDQVRGLRDRQVI